MPSQVRCRIVATTQKSISGGRRSLWRELTRAPYSLSQYATLDWSLTTELGSWRCFDCGPFWADTAFNPSKWASQTHNEYRNSAVR